MVSVVAALFKEEQPSGASDGIEHECTMQEYAGMSADGQGQDGGPTADLEEWLGSVGET